MRAQIRQLRKLLALLQVHLESAIESELIPGETEPAPEFAHNVAIDRRDWRAAEDFIMFLGGKPRKRGHGIPHPPFVGKAAA